jgi:hypothetical protein
MAICPGARARIDASACSINSAETALVAKLRLDIERGSYLKRDGGKEATPSRQATI